MQSDLTGVSGQRMLLCIPEEGRDLHPSNISIFAGKADPQRPLKSRAHVTQADAFTTKAIYSLVCMDLENQLFYLLDELS